MPHKRSCRLMDHKVMLEIAEHDPDTEKIFEDNLLTPFTHRDQQDCEKFVSKTLWQTMIGMAKMLIETGSTRNSRNLVFQTTSSLTQKRKHREKTTTTFLILLFVPFRTESSLLLDSERAVEAFHRLVNPDCSSYPARLQMLEAQSNVKKIHEARHADHEEKISKDDEPHLMGEAKTTMKDVIDMNVNSSSDLSLESRVAMLNTDQRHIIDNVKSHLLHQQQHKEMSLQ